MKKRFYAFEKDNRGISLVELIIVIAIMVVLTAAISLGVSTFTSKHATQCAKNMQISLNRNRLGAMGKKNAYVAFIQNDDGVFMVERFDSAAYDDAGTRKEAYADDPDAVRIGKAGLVVTVNGTDLTAGPQYIEFNRSDGSLKSPSTLEIVVKKGSIKTCTLTVEPLTGKVEFSQD